jgi:hypothetical protein
MEPFHLTILIPGIASPPKMSTQSLTKNYPRLFEFERLLSRSLKSETSVLTFDQQLFQLFSMNYSIEEDLPVAAISYLWDTGEATTNSIFRADPVRLEPNRDQLVLFDVDVTQLSDDVINLLMEKLYSECRGDDWKIIMPNKTRWYLEFQLPLEVRTSRLDEVVGTTIGEHLPSGTDAHKIRIIFNEVQMIMHSLLQTLQDQSESLLFNSLWFWGSGRLPEVSKQKDTEDYWAEIWSDNVLALGLGKLNGVKSNMLPESAQQLIGQEKKTGNHLLILEALHRKNNMNNPERWWQQAELIHDQWIAPLVNAINARNLLSLTIIDNEGSQYFATKKNLNRWWKRTKPYRGRCE